MTTRVARTLVKLALTGACGRAGKDYCDVLITSKGNKRLDSYHLQCNNSKLYLKMIGSNSLLDIKIIINTSSNQRL